MSNGVDVIKSTIDLRLRTGSKSVGTTAVQFGDTAVLFVGVTIRAASSNTGIIYVGGHANITADSAPQTDGFPLQAGDAITIPVDAMTKVWVIASAASQKIFWLGQ